jgi:DNA-binding CsgD family transcriptional regulator
MPARFLGGLDLRATIGCWRRFGMGTPGSWRVSTFVLTLVVGSSVAWFIDWRVTELRLGDVLARASDQVELGLLPRVTPEDFEPPYTQAKLDALDARLDPLLDRAREPGSGVIRVDLFARDGTVLYSDLASLQSRVVSPLADPRLAAALAGSASAEVTPLTHQEDADLQSRYGTALEAYVPCMLDGRVVGAYEVYVEPGSLWPMRWTIWTSVGLGFILLYLCMAAVRRRAGRAVAPARAGEIGGSVSLPAVIRTGLVRLDPGGDAPVAGASARRASGRLAGAAGTRTSECWLSRREMEVLQLLATNRTYRDIAGELSLSEETVRSHVKSILHKLGQPDRARAVAAGVRAGIVRT